MPITLAEPKPDSIALESTRAYPRTTLDAFPDDRAEYACALEGPRPRRGWSTPIERCESNRAPFAQQLGAVHAECKLKTVKVAKQ